MNGVVKFRCKPQSTPRSFASSAARSESAMKTMALVDDTVPTATHSKIRSVVSISRPQSSAFTMSELVELFGNFAEPTSAWMPEEGGIGTGTGLTVVTGDSSRSGAGQGGNLEVWVWLALFRRPRAGRISSTVAFVPACGRLSTPVAPDDCCGATLPRNTRPQKHKVFRIYRMRWVHGCLS